MSLWISSKYVKDQDEEPRRGCCPYINLTDELGGGGSSGIDAVLAVGQPLTDDRTIDCDGNTLVINNMNEFGIISPLGSGWTINGGADYDVNMVTTNAASELNLIGKGIVQVDSEIAVTLRGSASATPPTLELNSFNDAINIITNNGSGVITLTAGSRVNLNPTGNLQINGTNGQSGTFTFGGGGSGDIASMTFVKGILTATTLVP